MQNARKLQFAQSRTMVAFPSRATAHSARTSETRMQFEKLLIFVLCLLWAVGMVLWTLVSVVGIGHGGAPGSLAIDSFSLPSSMPTLQSATVFVVRLAFGW